MPDLQWEDLTPEERDYVTVGWDGREVPLQRVLDTAAKHKTSPQNIMSLGTPQGKFMARVADTMVGRGFLRAAQGFEDVAYTGLELAAKSGLAPKSTLGNIQARRASQDSFDEFITRGGQTEELLGPVGARVFDGAIRSTAKFAIPGGVGLKGTKALGTIYGMVGAESANDAHNQAIAAGAEPGEALLYAGQRAAIDIAVMGVMGRFATSKGLATWEEGLSPGLRAAASRVLNKNGVADDLAVAIKGIVGGAAIETVEEGTQTALGQVLELANGYRDDFDYQQIFEASLTGAVAAGTTQSVATAAEKYKPIAAKLDALQPQIENATIGVAAAESYMPQSSSEQIEAVLNTTGFQDLKQTVPDLPVKNAEQAEAFREEVKRQAEELQRDSQMVSEVAAKPGQDVSLLGVPEPQNAKEATAAASGVMTARTYQELESAAQRYGQEGYFSPGRTSQAKVGAEARKLGLHTKDNATRIAEEVIANPNALTSLKQEALKIRDADVEGEIFKLNQALDQAETPGQVANLMAEIDTLNNEGLRLVNAMQLGGTPAAQMLALRRTAQTSQYGPVGILASAITNKKAPLTNAERNDLTKDALELQKQSKAVDAVEEAAFEQQALKGLEEANQTQASEDLMSLYEKVNTLLKSGCDLG